jgi:hypothetical protein
MRAVNLRFYNKRLSESRAIEQNQENPMGAGWTAYFIRAKPGAKRPVLGLRSETPAGGSPGPGPGRWRPQQSLTQTRSQSCHLRTAAAASLPDLT